MVTVTWSDRGYQQVNVSLRKLDELFRQRIVKGMWREEIIVTSSVSLLSSARFFNADADRRAPPRSQSREAPRSSERHFAPDGRADMVAAPEEDRDLVVYVSVVHPRLTLLIALRFTLTATVRCCYRDVVDSGEANSRSASVMALFNDGKEAALHFTDGPYMRGSACVSIILLHHRRNAVWR